MKNYLTVGEIFMSGHSKWSTIKRKKEKTDAQKASVFTKMAREISVAVKEGGADPASNGKLRDIIAKAKSQNVPSDNITRIIKKASSDDKENYEAIMYEGYGPNGIAVIVEALTDNRNRTAANMRHYFDKFGGNLGTTGCVAFMFTQKGILVIDEYTGSEDSIMESAIIAGAEDISFEDSIVEITTAPSDLRAVREALEENGYSFVSAEIAYIPANTTKLTDENDMKKIGLLLNALDDDDDVQNYWTSLENEDEIDR